MKEAYCNHVDNCDMMQWMLSLHLQNLKMALPFQILSQMHNHGLLHLFLNQTQEHRRFLFLYTHHLSFLTLPVYEVIMGSQKRGFSYRQCYIVLLFLI